MLGKSLGLTEDLAGMAVRNWLSVESGGMQQQFKALHGVVRPQDPQFFEIQEKTANPCYYALLSKRENIIPAH